MRASSVMRLWVILSNQLKFFVWKSLCEIRYAYFSVIDRFKERQKLKAIVSLTSFPRRYKYLHLVIKSLLSNTVLPEKIVLYLCSSELNECQIPQDLLSLGGDLFEIRTVEKGYRSFSKLLHARDDFPTSNILTVDDDLIYHHSFLVSFLKFVDNEEATVISGQGVEVCLHQPYREWPRINAESSGNAMVLGYSGVLYKSGALHKLVRDAAVFQKVCPHNDDIWFSCCARLNGVKKFFYSGANVRANKDIYYYHPDIENPKLSDQNLNGRLEIEFKSLNEWLAINYGADWLPY